MVLFRRCLADGDGRGYWVRTTRSFRGAVASGHEHTRTSAFAFGDPLMGSYFPSPRTKVPEDDPSMNSIAGGRRLLKASMSLAGRYWVSESTDLRGENEGVGYRGEANILPQYDRDRAGKDSLRYGVTSTMETG